MNISDITNTTCITPDCNNKAAPGYGRGLCQKCYSSAKRAVESGKVTWDRLEELGLALPKDDPFTKALDKATRELPAE